MRATRKTPAALLLSMALLVSAAAARAAPSGGEADATLKKIAGHTFGQSREDLAAVEKLSCAAGRDPALRKNLAIAMTRMLSSGASADCKKFLCRQLMLIGTAQEVPALAALLGEKDLSTAARFALARIPGDAPLAAMRAAMDKAPRDLLIGLINTLGERRDARAVGAIAKRLTGADAVVTGACLDALGKIGGSATVKALSAAEGNLADELQPALAGALLRCGEGLLASGDTAQAAAIFKKLSAPNRPKHVRTAAFPGLVACRKDGAATLLKDALTGSEPALQSAAIRCARSAGAAALTKVLADELPNLPPAIQVQMIDALAHRGDTAALPAVMATAASEVSAVRLAALAALGSLGNADTTAYLAGLAAKSQGAEQRVARASLARLQGAEVDAAMIGLLEKGASPVRREVIIALKTRGTPAAVPALLAAAEDADRAVGREALKALRQLADAKDCPALLGILTKPGSEALRPDIENALVTISRRTDTVGRTVASVVRSLSGAAAPQRGSLLRVLGRLGGAESLQAVRGALKDENDEVRDAAIRALAEWADASALEDLLAVARSASQARSKVLALRGFATLAGQAKDRTPEGLAKLFADATQLADRPDEKKALLGALAGVHCVKAMQLAASNLSDAAVANEAALAAVQIAEAVWRHHPADAKAVLKQVRASVKAPAVNQRVTAVLLAMSKPVNLAIGATATSPDGFEKDGQAGGDQAAIDGNPNTYWDEVNGKKLYILRVALKEPAEVSAISILGYQHHGYAPKDFQVLCDGKVVKTVRGARYEQNERIVTFPAVRCKTLELKITGYYGASPAIRELEIYHVDPATQQE